MNLQDAKQNEKVEIIKMNAQGSLLKRLYDLGFLKGTQVMMLFRNPFDNMHAYRINGSIIALRKEDAKKIKVKVC